MATKRNSASVKRAELDAILSEDAMHAPINFDDREPVKPDNEERIVIFHLNGKDYSILKRPQVHLGLQFSRDRRNYGNDIAMVNMLQAMLGEEGFEALINYDGLTDDDFGKISEICSRAALGKLEAQKQK